MAIHTKFSKKQAALRASIELGESRFSARSSFEVVTRTEYLASVAVTVILAAAQLILFPLFLSASDFGAVILALSILQAIQQFGDCGFLNAAARIQLPESERTWFRESALSITTFVGLCGAVLSVVAGSLGLVSRSVSWTIALSLCCGVALVASKVRANQAHNSGNERRALLENLVWQNAPKVGMIVALVSHSSLIVLAFGLLGAIVLGRPRVILLVPKLAEIRATATLWVPSFLLVATSYFVSWTDTFALSFFQGASQVGVYQVVTRPLLAIVYFYAPVLSILQASMNRREWKRSYRLALVVSAGSFLVIVSVCAFLISLGSAIWPMYSFPTSLVLVLGIAAWFSTISATFGTMVLVSGQHSVSAAANIIGALVILVLSIVLVPVCGLLGAAISSACGWFITAAVQVLVVLLGRRDVS